ncbi:type 2 isopentenyl-diphosphate Delta-isomerase [Verrucomicrobiota bacterium]
MTQLNRRKEDHLRIVTKEEGVDRNRQAFAAVQLIHRALPELDLAEVDTSIEFLGKTISCPLIISSMTGGAGSEIERINRNLAEAAEAEGIGMAVGSQRVFFTNKESAGSFRLREFAPTIPLMGNLGAVQFNYGMDSGHCREAAKLLGADGFYLHLNPLQEAVQPEGDTNFAGLAEKIGAVVRELNVPVLVKAVGAGISPADVQLLIGAGVKYVDVAGAGGTSWSLIEAHRSGDPSLGELFADWGIPTPQALQLLNPYRRQVQLIASGGVRSGVDMAKSLVLGASLCGVAGPLLEPAMDSVDAVRIAIQRFKREFKTAMFLLGCRKVSDLVGNDSLLLKP